MVSIVQGIYPDLAWDITPDESIERLSLPAADIEIAGESYQMVAASFDKSDGTVFLTPGGYAFVGADQTKELKAFPNGENYWIAAISDGDVMVLKAVKES